ncbi:hypothetical protein [Novosphingobium sp.]|nr:hypothetical protein [Novosphingobium sp.]
MQMAADKIDLFMVIPFVVMRHLGNPQQRYSVDRDDPQMHPAR